MVYNVMFGIGIHCEIITTVKLINRSITSHSYHWVSVQGVRGEDLKHTLSKFKYTMHYY